MSSITGTTLRAPKMEGSGGNLVKAELEANSQVYNEMVPFEEHFQEPHFGEGRGGRLETVIKTEDRADAVVNEEECEVVYILSDDDDESGGEDVRFQPGFESGSNPKMPVKLTEHRTERANFVFKWTKYSMDRLCSRNGNPSRITQAERQQMWEKITQLTNDKFAPILGAMNVKQIKRIFTSRLSQNARPILAQTESERRIYEERLASTSMDDPDGQYNTGTEPTLHGVKTEATVNDEYDDSLIKTEDCDMEDHALTDEDEREDEHVLLESDSEESKQTLFYHRSTRINFVEKWTKYYLEHFAQSYATKAEMQQIYKQVTQLTNKKFAHLLGTANTKQIRKMYTNRVAKPTKSKTLTSAAASPPIQLNASLKRIFDRSGEEFLMQRIDMKDAEIDSLQKEIIKQADEHRSRMNGMLEMVKISLGDVQQDYDNSTRILRMPEMMKVAVGEQNKADIAAAHKLE